MMVLVKCEECGAEISDKAFSCPKCGHPKRAVPFMFQPGLWRWWGYEWKSSTTILGWPLVHVAIGWDPETGRLMVARGIIAIGQFGIGLFTIAQFGIGLLLGVGQFIAGTFVVGQFALGILYALGQFAAAYYYAAGQFAVGKYARSLFHPGRGI